MTSRYKKVGYTAAAGLGLFLGAAGIAAAATGDSSTPPAPASQTVEVDGVNCENGIDTATGAECDGGPAAAQADESTEAPDNEADVADEADVAEGSDEAVDGVDHQFEGEEVGENGNGIPDADEANEVNEAGD